MTLCNAGSAAATVTVRAINPAARDRGDLKTCPPADGCSVVAATLQPLTTATVELTRPEQPPRSAALHDVAVEAAVTMRRMSLASARG